MRNDVEHLLTIDNSLKVPTKKVLSRQVDKTADKGELNPRLYAKKASLIEPSKVDAILKKSLKPFQKRKRR